MTPIKTEDDYLLKFCIDLELVAKENKFDPFANASALNFSLSYFNQYIKKHTDVDEFFSINHCELSYQLNNNFNVSVYYPDSSKKELIKSTICDLVNYSVKTDDAVILRGEELQIINPEKFFDSFMINIFKNPDKVDTNNSPYIKIEEIHLISADIDLNLFSRKNQLGHQTNLRSLNVCFDEFNNYLHRFQDIKQLLSINKAESFYGNKEFLPVSIQYSDLSKKDMVQSILADLVTYATTNDGYALKGLTLKPNDPKEIFENLLMPYVLELTLKNDTENKAKRNKI